MLEPFVPFFPMEPTLGQEAFDDLTYGFQVKWDGVRILAHVKDNRVELFNRKKNDRTRQYPEVVLALASIFKGDVILDGEIVALKNGKPNFSQLIRRDFAIDEKTVKYLSGKIPVTYVIFDILYHNNEGLTVHPFLFRDELLKTLISSRDPIVTTDTFPHKGVALFSVVKEAGLEGIVAKKLESQYHIAKKSSDWLKIKNRRNLTAFVGGYLFEGGEVRSLFLGVFEDNDFLYVGRAGSGINRSQSRRLFERFQRNTTSHCPFVNSPPIARREDPRWVSPSIEVLIEYMDFTDDGYLRHPVIKQIAF